MLICSLFNFKAKNLNPIEQNHFSILYILVFLDNVEYD